MYKYNPSMLMIPRIKIWTKYYPITRAYISVTL